MRLALPPLLIALTGCVTYKDVKELKMVGFAEDVSKGNSVGQFEADDCVFQILGYSLGGAPDISRAIANARTQKKSGIADAVVEGTGSSGSTLRYASNVTAEYGGFNAVVVGKSCIQVKGMGYL